MKEFISCVMVTKDRPRFFRQALRYFLRQTYTDAELVVIDDGTQPVGEYCEGYDRVRYLHLDTPTSQGAKLNLGIEMAQGDLIQKLDDDDYYHPDFLKVAVEGFPATDRDSWLQSWDCFLILLVSERRLRYSGHGWIIGNTICFTRRFWEKGKFRNISRGVDWAFLRDHRPPIARVCAPEHCIVVRHGRNTWTHMRKGGTTDAYLSQFDYYGKELNEVIPAGDCAFYEELATETAGAGSSRATE